MKISPMAPGSQGGIVNPNEGRSASPEHLERAKSIARGETPEERAREEAPSDPVQVALKKIKMRTNYNPTARAVPPPPPPAPPEVAPPEEQAAASGAEVGSEELKSDTLERSESDRAVLEAAKPLSPQVAALAREKRALQLKQQELLAKEKALGGFESDKKLLEEYRARIKANALAVLQEEGVTYDQLTEQILATSPESGEISSVKAELKALKQGLEDQKKAVVERDERAEKQALSQIKRDIDHLISQGDDFQMIREAGYAEKVVELIHKTWKQSGELLETTEAAALIETELLEESLKFARIAKVQSRLNPAKPLDEPSVQPAPAVKTDRPGVKIMKTLTNRDGVSSHTMSRRERAIAAMEGRLK